MAGKNGSRRNSTFNIQLEKLNKNAVKVLLDEIGLREKTYTALHKKYVEEKSYNELAEDMSYTVESARVLLHKARNELKEIVIEQSDTLELTEQAERIVRYLMKEPINKKNKT